MARHLALLFLLCLLVRQPVGRCSLRMLTACDAAEVATSPGPGAKRQKRQVLEVLEDSDKEDSQAERCTDHPSASPRQSLQAPLSFSLST